MELSIFDWLSDSVVSAILFFLEFFIDTSIDLLFFFLDVLPQVDLFSYISLESMQEIYQKLVFANLFFPVWESFLLITVWLNAVIIFAIVKFFIKMIPFVG